MIEQYNALRYTEDDTRYYFHPHSPRHRELVVHVGAVGWSWSIRSSLEYRWIPFVLTYPILASEYIRVHTCGSGWIKEHCIWWGGRGGGHKRGARRVGEWDWARYETASLHYVCGCDVSPALTQYCIWGHCKYQEHIRNRNVRRAFRLALDRLLLHIFIWNRNALKLQH